MVATADYFKNILIFKSGGRNPPLVSLVKINRAISNHGNRGGQGDGRNSG